MFLNHWYHQDAPNDQVLVIGIIQDILNNQLCIIGIHQDAPNDQLFVLVITQGALKDQILVIDIIQDVQNNQVLVVDIVQDAPNDQVHVFGILQEGPNDQGIGIMIALLNNVLHYSALFSFKVTVIQVLESASNVFLKLKETIVNTAKLDFLVMLLVECVECVGVICLVQIRPIMIVTELLVNVTACQM